MEPKHREFLRGILIITLLVVCMGMPVLGDTEQITSIVSNQGTANYWGTGDVVYNDVSWNGGPFLYRKKDGQLLMFWSSFGERGYALGIARSQSGSIIGPWNHDQEPLFADDGGHGMLFETFDGQLTLALHRPNISPNERAVFIPLSLRDL